MTSSKKQILSKAVPSAFPLPDKDTQATGMSLSMHDGVEVWCDCCSCEAEPYWLAAFEDRELSPEQK